MNKLKKSLIYALVPTLLGGMALSVTSCGNGKNGFAYDIDFNADIRGQSIKMWTGFGQDISAVLESAIEEFEALTGVDVEYESKGGYDKVLDATILAAPNVDYPHVVVGYPDHFATYVKQDIIVRLDYYFENDVPQPFEGDETFKISDFYPDYMRENQSIEYKKDGTPWTLGVPFNKSTEVMIYNKTFFDHFAQEENKKYGIYIPATYDELNESGTNILNFIKTNDIYGKVYMKNGDVLTEKQIKEMGDTFPYKDIILDLRGIKEWNDKATTNKDAFRPFSYDSQANLFITTVRQFGGTYTYYDKEARHGYVGFDSKETRQGLSKLLELYDNHVFGIPADWGAEYGSIPFQGSKTVMTLGSSAGVSHSTPPANKFKIAAAPVPYHSEESKYVISQGANLALLDTGTREERLAAWTLIKFLTKYANGAICAQTGYYPASPYAENGGMWAEMTSLGEKFIDYKSWIDFALNTPTAQTGEKIKAQAAMVNIDNYINSEKGWVKFVDDPFPGSANIREEVKAVPGWVFSKQKTIDEAIAAVLAKVKDYVKK